MANGKKSKKKRVIIISVLVVVLAVAVALVILGGKREVIITVQTEKTVKRTITQIVSATGKIQPVVQVPINAEVSGEIINLPVREGQRVRRGDLLVRIKPDAYQAAVDRADAAVASSRANLMKAEADYKRVKELFAKSLISESELDIAKAAFESAKASANQNQASLKESRETLAKSTVYAPMDGTISSLKCELAQRVSGSTFTQGTEIMTVADLSKMEARVDVGENDIVNVTLGDTARIQVDAYPDRKFTGVVTQIANTAKTRGLGTQEEITNFEVRILIHQPPGIVFRPGMSMTADIETERKQGVLAVPIQSVTTRMPKEGVKEQQPQEGSEGGAKLATKQTKKKEEEKIDEVVFIIKDGIAKTAVVKRGISDETHVEITGLEEGTEVVSGPFKAINRELEDGSKVKVDNEKARKSGSAAQQTASR
jgi:HlyD family secretion protein